MKKSILVLFFAFSTIFLFGQTSVQPAGSGTESSPYLITSLENLYWVSVQTNEGNSFVGKFFKQTNNINATITSTWFEGDGWIPIGNNSNPFSGSYDGDGKYINGIMINRPDENSMGLFGVVRAGIISNLEVSNLDITGNSIVGGLVGSISQSATIDKCNTSGEINGINNVGGLAGCIFSYNSDTHIINSYSNTIVNGSTHVGGLIGYNESGINSSYSAGDVNGHSYVGGLIGLNSAYNNIINSYSTGNVTAYSHVGGLIGSNMGYFFIDNSYSIGYVKGELFTGGLVGSEHVLFGWVTNCFWNIEASGQLQSAGGEGKSTLEMIHFETFVTWDFLHDWNMIYGETYPFLQWQSEPNNNNFPSQYTAPSNLYADLDGNSVRLTWKAPSTGEPDQYNIYKDGLLIGDVSAQEYYNDYDVADYNIYEYQVTAIYNSSESVLSNRVNIFYFQGFDGGDGTIDNPYLVSNDDQLYATRYYLFSSFLQIADIDLSDSQWTQNDGWVPIGDVLNRFQGYYNGNNHSINGLYINRPVENNQGLFGYTLWSDISNVIITNADVLGKDYVGALAGINKLSSILNCRVTGSVSGQNIIGGIVGENIDSYILNCQNNAMVNGYAALGGIAGINKNMAPGDIPKSNNKRYFSAQISYCSNTGNITGSMSLGGIAGLNSHFAIISESYNEGSISSTSKAGGITFYNDMGKIINCYNTGSVSGENTIGGIVGENDDIPEYGIGYVPNIINSYNIGLINSSINSGGLVGTGVSANLVGNSYWNTETSEISVSVGGEAKTTEEMTYPYNSNVYVDWDFENIWVVDEGYQNNGYPFLEPAYALSIIIVGKGAVSVNGQTFHYPHMIKNDSEVTIIANAENNWVFSGWSGNIISDNIEEFFTMNDNKTIIASFEPITPDKYTLSLYAYPVVGGTVTGEGTYNIGENVVISALPSTENNYYFIGWYVLNELISEDSEYTFEMPDKNITIIGKFESSVSVLQHEQLKVSLHPNPFRDYILINNYEKTLSR